MRQINQTGRDDELAIVPQIVSGGGLGEIFIAVTRRHYLAIALSALLGMALGGVYSVLATPSFTASTKLFVEDPKAQSSPPPDTAFVGSQVELIRSDNVAVSVIRDLHLIDDLNLPKPAYCSLSSTSLLAYQTDHPTPAGSHALVIGQEG